jgi:hypothetical protein
VRFAILLLFHARLGDYIMGQHESSKEKQGL